MLFVFRNWAVVLAVLAAMGLSGAAAEDEFERVLYNHPGLVVDLGVGLWAQPLPMDFTGNGVLDLVVATNDVPYNGIYVFEHPGGETADPVFRPAVRLGGAVHNITVSYVDGEAHVLTPNTRHPRFRTEALEAGEPMGIAFDHGFERTRANQWKLTDFNGNGLLDVVIGLGVWDDYGWDDAFDDEGRWTNGPLHGYVYIALNEGTEEAPVYGEPFRLDTADGAPVDVFGAPSPNFADWDGDGDLDLICGSFLDTLTYFENVGTRTEPRYAPGRPVRDPAGKPITMDLQMLQVIAIDWTRNGLTDLVVGQEDGRVALLVFTGEARDGAPVFETPAFFRQEADGLKIGALATPVSVDWDGDGIEDLIVGDTAGYLNFVKNLDGGNPPKWAPPVYLEADGEVIRIQAGVNGSIQGPAEAKWGYTAPSVADWNHNGLPDIVVNSIWGKVVWYENIGTRSEPRLRAAQPVEVAWDGDPPKPSWVWWTPEGRELATQWRTTPLVHDLNGDGLNDLVMLDHEGYLAFFERRPDGLLMPGQRVFLDEAGEALRLNDGHAGRSGRRKFVLHDWDGGGRVDLLINSRPNIDVYRNVSDGPAGTGIVFRAEGPVASQRLAGHTTSPTIVHWGGAPGLLVGAEDGFLYYLRR